MAVPLKKPIATIHESLDVYNDPKDATVDIVVIPGLGANAVKSWQCDGENSSFNWIIGEKDKDGNFTGGLPKDCEKARVLLYNYASAYQGNYKIKQYFTNIVKMLLDQLQYKREGKPKRPLVFLGHSMGGLVIAKTLVIAEQQRDNYPGMYECISGCLFFGTPFDGAPVADIAKEWTTINERLGTAINSKLIDLLTPQNEALRELKHDFVRSVNKLGQKVEVHCFWERKETHWEAIMKKLASQEFPSSSLEKLGLTEYREFVSRDSATLPGIGDTGIARTHRDLVRFESPKDPEYQLVKTHIRRIVVAAPLTARGRFNATRQSAIDRPTYKKIIDILEGAEPQRKLKAVQRRSTAESWIVRDKEPEYMHWSQSDARQDHYLWIHGPEGRGKSNTSATIIKAVEEHIGEIDKNPDKAPHLLAYFFCEESPDYCTAEDLVKSLMRQLCQQQEILATYAGDFVKKDDDPGSRKKATLSIENLWQRLQSMLSEATIDTIYFVINNLHNLANSLSTDKLRALIKENIERVHSGKNNKVRAKWLITSQSWQVFRNTIHSTEVRDIDLDDPKHGDQQQGDLRKYAWSKAEGLRKEKGYTMATAYLAGSVIGNRAGNTKWIDAAIAQLAILPAHSSEMRVQRVLERAPESLETLLNEAWLSILKPDNKDTDIIRELLRALVLTYEDPREDELLVLSGLSGSSECQTHLQVLVNECKPLIITRSLGPDTIIGFVNADVKKHLLSHSQQLLNIGDDWIKWQHGKSALNCFSHIIDALKAVPTETNPTTPEKQDVQDKDTAETHSPTSGIEIDSPISEVDLVISSGGQETVAAGTEAGLENDNVDASDDESSGPLVSSNQSKRPLVALPYATRYWMKHASDAPLDIAQVISQDGEFWKPKSMIRLQWLLEYEDLTKSLDGFNPEFENWTALHVAASIGFTQLVEALLEKYKEEIHQHDKLDNTPLHLAAWYGNLKIVERLLFAGAKVDDMGPGGKSASPLAMAAFRGQTAVMKKLIVEWQANFDAVDDEEGPVINAAILSGSTDAVELLLQHSPKLNYDLGEVKVAPLAMLAYYSDLEMFDVVLEKAEGLSPDEFDKALIWAAASDNLDILKRLLAFEHDHDVYQKGLMSATKESNWDSCLAILIHSAAQGLECNDLFTRAATGSETLIEVLEACWANSHEGINKQVLNTCLYEATDNEKESTVRLLLKFGADPNSTGESFGNALTASANDGTHGIVKLLLTNGADVNSPHGYALQQAAGQGHVEVLKLLLDHHADINEVNDHHEALTSLQAACNSGHMEAVRLLLERGADPNLGGGSFTRPILGALWSDPAVLEELLKAESLELDFVGGPLNSTPLYAAAMMLPAPFTAWLIDHGATIDFVDQDGDTALIAAAYVGDADSVRLLLERGADFLKVGRTDKGTALEAAMTQGHEECVKIILARVNVVLRGLQEAAEKGDERARDLISGEKEHRKEIVAKEKEDKEKEVKAAEKAERQETRTSESQEHNAAKKSDEHNGVTASDGRVEHGDSIQVQGSKAGGLDFQEAQGSMQPGLEDACCETGPTGYPSPRSETGGTEVDE